jgi:glutamate racemase
MATAIAERYPHTRGSARLGTRVYLTTGDPQAMRQGAARARGTTLTAKLVRSAVDKRR